MKKLFSIMSHLQTYYHFKLDLQNVEQHAGHLFTKQTDIIVQSLVKHWSRNNRV